MKKKLNPEPSNLAPTFLSAFCIVFLGIFVLLLATDFGQSFTTEGYRRHQIDVHSEPVPNMLLVDSRGVNQHLQDFIIQDGRFVILDFFYTSCRTICNAQAGIFNSLQEKIKAQHLEDQVRLISVSFDPKRDDLKAIQGYASRVKADPSVWSLFTLSSSKNLKSLLDDFGIYVIKVPPFGDLDHNASFHLIDPKGNLIKISSLDDVDDLLSIVKTKIKYE
jgi:protein SCO1/2